MNKKIKILYIMPSLRVCNGVANYAMNYYRNIDKNKFQIDFIVGLNERSIYYDEIESNGGKIFYIPKINFKNIRNVSEQINNFFKSNKYDIIHCHVLNMGAFYMYYANKHDVNVRILHSHVTKSADTFINKIRNDFLLKIAIYNSNYLCACSKMAGEMIFGKKKFRIIYNAINIEKFKYNEISRKRIRKELNITEDEIIIGNVGRFCNQKNQLRLVEIFKKFISKNPKSKLIIIGNGKLKNAIHYKCKKMNIDENVLIMDTKNNIEDYYQAFDAFVLPSKYEGLGIVLIEAQIAGLPCVVSNVIPKEAKITEDIYAEVNLKDTNLKWSEKIEEVLELPNNRIDNKINVEKYKIIEASNELANWYNQIYTKEKK